MTSRAPHARTIRAAIAASLLLALAIAAPAAAAGLAYETKFRGIADARLVALIKSVSGLATGEKAKAPNRIALERRATSDAGRIREVLHSEAYYDAVIDHDIAFDRKPIQVVVEIDLGPRYLVSRIDIRADDPANVDSFVTAAIENAEHMSGSPAKASDVVAMESRLLDDVRASGRPFTQIIRRRYVVDHSASAMIVEIGLDIGAAASFGPVRFVGLDAVEEDYLRRRIPWKEGARYDPAALERGRRDMAATGLLSSVRFEHAENVDENGSLPITVHVEEARFRTVGVGVRYDSSLGAGVGASWEHRNVRGGGERLRLASDVAEAGWSSSLTWREPDVLRTGDALTYAVSYAEEDTTAYRLRRAATTLSIAMPLTSTLAGTAGVGLEWTPVETKARETVTGDREQDETFLLLGFPMSLSRATTDSLLEPRDGTRVTLAIMPYVEVSGKDLAFVVMRVSPSLYVPFRAPGLRESVLATRLSIGSIGGEKRDDVPAQKRFYSGGGGSIRGYEYQRVGPLDEDDEPLGGRSLLEAGTELRLRISESFGIVGFFEGGNVYRSLYPDLDDTIRWGSGGGLRYYSAAGPLRLDIATPVNGRDGIDHPVQFYISLGEAF